MTKPKRHCALAARLLEELLLRTDWETGTLSHALNLTDTQLEEYRSGKTRMTVEQQLGLAAFVLSRAPECSRLARRLVSQANAEAMFLRKETVTHMVAPPSQYR